MTDCTKTSISLEVYYGVDCEQVVATTSNKLDFNLFQESTGNKVTILQERREMYRIIFLVQWVKYVEKVFF